MPKKVNKIEALNLGMSGNVDPQEELRPVETINVDLNQTEGILVPSHAYSATGVTQDSLVTSAEKIYHLIDPQNEEHRLYLKNGILYKKELNSANPQVYVETILSENITDTQLYGNTFYNGKGSIIPSTYLHMKEDGSFVEYPQDVDPSEIFTNLIYEVDTTAPIDTTNYLTIYSFVYKNNTITKEVFSKVNDNSLSIALTYPKVIEITEPGNPSEINILDICYDTDPANIYIWYTVNDILKVGRIAKSSLSGTSIPLEKMFPISSTNLDFDRGVYSPSKIEILNIPIPEGQSIPTNPPKRMLFAFSKANNQLLKSNFLSVQDIYFHLTFSIPETTDKTLIALPFEYKTNGKLARLGMLNSENYLEERSNTFLYYYFIHNNFLFFSRLDLFGSAYALNELYYSSNSIQNIYWRNTIQFDFIEKNLFDWAPGMSDNSILTLRTLYHTSTLQGSSVREGSLTRIFTPRNPFGYWNGDIYLNAEKHWSTGITSNGETVNAWRNSNTTLNLRSKTKVGSNRGKCPVWRIVRDYQGTTEAVYIDIPYTGYLKGEIQNYSLHNKTNIIDMFSDAEQTESTEADVVANRYKNSSVYSYCFPGLYIPFITLQNDSNISFNENVPNRKESETDLIFNFNRIIQGQLRAVDFHSSIFLNMYGNFAVDGEKSIYKKCYDTGNNYLAQISIANGDSYSDSWWGKGYIYGGQNIPDGLYRFILYDVVTKYGVDKVSVKNTLNTIDIPDCYDSKWTKNEGDSNTFFRFKIQKIDEGSNTLEDTYTGAENWYAYDNFHIQCFPATVNTAISPAQTNWEEATINNVIVPGIKTKVNRNHTVENSIVKIDNENALVYDSTTPYLYDDAYKYSEAQQLMLFGHSPAVPGYNYIIPYNQNIYKFKSTNSNFANDAVVDISGGIIVDKDKDGEDIKINDITSIDAKKEGTYHMITYTRNTPYEDGLEGHDGVQSKIYRDSGPGYISAPDLSGYNKVFNYVSGATPYWIEMSNSASAPFKIFQSFPPNPSTNQDNYPYIVLNGQRYFFSYDTINKDYSLFPYSVNWADEQTLFYNRGFKITSVNLLTSSEKGFSDDLNYRYGYCFELKNGNFSNFVGWKYDGHNSKDDRYLKAIVNKQFLIEKGIYAVKVFISYTTKGSDNWSIPEEIYSVQLEDLTIYLDSLSGSTIKDEEITLLIELISGQTYESLSGVSHTLIDTTLNYNYSVVSNNYNFVINATNESISAFKESEFLLFRSKKDLLTTFDWANDYLRIPEKVVGLAAIHGRIVIFSQDNVSVVDAETMEFLQVIQDIEIVSKDSWCIVEDKWMVLSCKSGAYVFDGTEFTRISSDIEHNWKDDTAVWKDYEKVFPLAKDSKIYFWNIENNDNKIKALVWHYPSKKWGYEEIPSRTTMIYNDIFENIPIAEGNKNPNGERYFFVNNSDYKLIEFDSTGGIEWKYVTNPLDMGMPDIKKVLYGVRFRMKIGNDFKYYEYTDNLPKYFYNVILNITATEKKIFSIEIMYRELTDRGSRFTSTIDAANGIDPTLEIDIPIPNILP